MISTFRADVQKAYTKFKPLDFSPVASMPAKAQNSLMEWATNGKSDFTQKVEFAQKKVDGEQTYAVFVINAVTPGWGVSGDIAVGKANGDLVTTGSTDDDIPNQIAWDIAGPDPRLK